MMIDVHDILYTFVLAYRQSPKIQNDVDDLLLDVTIMRAARLELGQCVSPRPARSGRPGTKITD